MFPIYKSNYTHMKLCTYNSYPSTLFAFVIAPRKQLASLLYPHMCVYTLIIAVFIPIHCLSIYLSINLSS